MPMVGSATGTVSTYPTAIAETANSAHFVITKAQYDTLVAEIRLLQQQVSRLLGEPVLVLE